MFNCFPTSSLRDRLVGGTLASRVGESLAIGSRAYAGLRFPWRELAAKLSLSLSERGRLDTEDWQKRLAPELKVWGQQGTSAAVALGVWPVAQYHHDRRPLLQAALLEAAAPWLLPTEAIADVLVFGSAIALGLRGELNLASGFSPLFAFLDLSAQTELGEQLGLVRESAIAGDGLAAISNRLSRSYPNSRTELARALEACRPAPEDVRSCLRRVEIDRSGTVLTGGLAGAIAGTVVGASGIPLPWRVALRRSGLEMRLRQSSDRLLAAWCGLDVELAGDVSWESIAVARSPGLQVRSPLPGLAQHE